VTLVVSSTIVEGSIDIDVGRMMELITQDFKAQALMQVWESY